METELENRYIVIKRADVVDADNVFNTAALKATEEFSRKIRENLGKPPMQCLVIEKDWPEYETVKAMLLARINSKDKPFIPSHDKPWERI